MILVSVESLVFPMQKHYYIMHDDHLIATILCSKKGDT